MTSNRSGSGSGSSNDREPYIQDADAIMTVRQHATRTAEKQAWWFLPHLRPGMALIDCGCASGSITVGLAEAVAPGHVTCIDISDVEIDRAKGREQRENVSNVSFAVGPIYELDFPNNSFDALFSHNMLEHVAEPNRALMEMLRVLKPGGVIGLRDFDIGGLLFSPETEMLQRFARMYETDWEELNGHPRLGRQLVDLLTQAGFADIVATASYEAYSGREGRKFVADVLVGGQLSDEAFVARVVGLGLATRDEISTMLDELLAWHDLPGAFFATAHVEVVGRKP